MSTEAAEEPIASAFLCEFGLRIRVLRTKRRMTQVSLAAAAGMDRTFIGHLERGQRAMSIRYLPRLAAALTVTVAELLDDGDVLRAAAETAALEPVPQV
jgi:transcriptional regulator with XRE-family HTH domain